MLLVFKGSTHFGNWKRLRQAGSRFWCFYIIYLDNPGHAVVSDGFDRRFLGVASVKRS